MRSAVPALRGFPPHLREGRHCTGMTEDTGSCVFVLTVSRRLVISLLQKSGFKRQSKSTTKQHGATGSPFLPGYGIIDS